MRESLFFASAYVLPLGLWNPDSMLLLADGIGSSASPSCLSFHSSGHSRTFSLLNGDSSYTDIMSLLFFQAGPRDSEKQTCL